MNDREKARQRFYALMDFDHFMKKGRFWHKMAVNTLDRSDERAASYQHQSAYFYAAARSARETYNRYN